MMQPTSTSRSTRTSAGMPRASRTRVERAEPIIVAPAIDPTQMDLASLEQRCQVESERFYRGQQHDTRYAYELFRRALVERDDQAWACIYNHYRNLVESWVRRSGAFASSGESSEYFVGPVFTRFWQAISAERFASFPTLAALLHYLQLCAGCVVIDSVRAQSWSEMVSEDAIPYANAPQTSPDEEAMERVSRAEFWEYIATQLSGEAERVVVFSSYVLGMKPGDIFQRYTHLFSSINDVYNVKRNVLGRLSRNQELRQMFGI
jgi:hypothetical protein